MSEFPERDPRTIKAVFNVWLSRDMLFNNPHPGKPGSNTKKYKKYTKAEKVKYSNEIIRRLNDWEEKYFEESGGDRCVAIRLDGIVRYMWRRDVLTEAEYGRIQEKQKAGISVIRSKLKRDVGKSGIE